MGSAPSPCDVRYRSQARSSATAARCARKTKSGSRICDPPLRATARPALVAGPPERAHVTATARACAIDGASARTLICHRLTLPAAACGQVSPSPRVATCDYQKLLPSYSENPARMRNLARMTPRASSPGRRTLMAAAHPTVGLKAGRTGARPQAQPGLGTGFIRPWPGTAAAACGRWRCPARPPGIRADGGEPARIEPTWGSPPADGLGPPGCPSVTGACRGGQNTAPRSGPGGPCGMSLTGLASAPGPRIPPRTSPPCLGGPQSRPG